MPSITINEKDYTVFNKALETDNIVYVPGFTIKGPYEPTLITSYENFINTYGNIPTDSYYAASASNATYKMCTSWEYAAQLLNQGFHVLFQRIVPYTIKDGTIDDFITIDTQYLRSANLTFTEVDDGETPIQGKFRKPMDSKIFGFKLKEKTGGIYGNRLKIYFMVNAARNKLFYKLVEDYKGETILEYKEICDIVWKTDGTNGKLGYKYLTKFAVGFVNAVRDSEYIEFDMTYKPDGSTVIAIDMIDYINAYIKKSLSVALEIAESNFSIDPETKYIILPDNAPASIDSIEFLEDISGSENKNFKQCIIDTILVRPYTITTNNNSEETVYVLSPERSEFGFGDESLNLAPTASEPNKTYQFVIQSSGKDYSINDALASDRITYLSDTIEHSLDIISDYILYDVKFITKGDIPFAGNDKGSLKTSEGRSLYNIMANFCKNRGDCVCILEPAYPDSDAPSEVPEEFVECCAGYIGSYSAAYAPWCVMTLFNGYQRWCPPSLIFLNTIAKSVDAGNPVYLPPAGVNRATVPEIVEPEYKIGSTILNQWQDKNELRNINPIMNLNTYGYVIFGQRTLYDVSDSVTTYRSALQELGVRLVTIECKKCIKRVAMGLIFEYNNIHTWNEFKAGLEPLFREMVQNGALQRYKIIMDDTTTSYDDIDDNIIRGTVKIVPGRAAEDFIISFELYRSSVKFDDEEEVNGY